MNRDPGCKRISRIALNRIAEERAKEDAEFRRIVASKGKPLLSHARMIADAELLEKLERVGIDLDKPTYGEVAEHAISSEEIFNIVVTAEVRSRFKTPHDEDWVWLALTILWERWFPQWPNCEHLNDQIQAGYAVLESDSAAGSRYAGGA